MTFVANRSVMHALLTSGQWRARSSVFFHLVRRSQGSFAAELLCGKARAFGHRLEFCPRDPGIAYSRPETAVRARHHIFTTIQCLPLLDLIASATTATFMLMDERAQAHGQDCTRR